MSRGIARLGDRAQGVCSHPSHSSPISVGGTIITASPDTNANNRGVARVNDLVRTDCGHTDKILTGSPDTNANNRAVARLNDLIGVDGIYNARIISASPDTNANS